MKQFEVVNPKGVTLASGVLQLSKDQADARTYALKSLGDGLYLIEKPVQFKNGEQFGYDGEVSKALLVEMEEVPVEEVPVEEVQQKGKGRK